VLDHGRLYVICDILDPDQADDLRELIDLTARLHEWLQSAGDDILDDLATFAYTGTFHPRSHVRYTEDPASISTRLQQATNSSCDPRDTPAPQGIKSRRSRLFSRMLAGDATAAARS